MTPTVVAGACILASQFVSLDLDDGAWLEAVRLEVGGSEDCVGVDLNLPDGVTLEAIQGRVRPADDPPYRLDAARFERVAVGVDGGRTWRVHLPELAAGDVATLDFTRRRAPPLDYAWTPGLDGAGFAELRLPKTLSPDDVQDVRQDGRTWWVDRPEPEARVVILHPWGDHDAPPIPPTARRDLDLAAAQLHVASLALLPEAFFGVSPPVGRDAVALGATDRRGVARTLVALTLDGPDQIELGRWAPDAQVLPRPGAPEFAVLWGRDHPVIVLHPDDPGLPDDGVILTGSGPVDLTAAGVDRWPGAASSAAPPADVSLHVAVEVDGRDPLRRLGPRGDLTWEARWRVTWPSARTGALFLPLPSDTVDVVQPLEGGCDRLREGPDAVWLVSAPGTSACEFTFVLPLRDAWSPMPPGPPGTTVTANATHVTSGGASISGTIVVEPEAWRLVELAGARLLADRATLERELAARFGVASMPEPAIPARVRAGRDGWELAEEVRALIARRAVIAPLPVPPDQPRRLQAARRGRVLTPVEAAMVGALHLRQAGLDARWALARPQGAGPPGGLAPVGFDRGVIRVEHDGRVTWIDPACQACPPLELPLELQGAPLLGEVEEERAP